MMHQYRERKPPTLRQREAAARDLADARRADREDPQRRLIRIMHAETSAVFDARRNATANWEAENAAVSLPRGLQGGEVHPQRAARLAEIIAAEGWSDDPREPLHPVRTVEEMLAGLIGRSQRRSDAARDALARLEQGEDIDVDAVMGAVDAEEPAPTPDPVKRGRGRPPNVLIDEAEAL